MGTDEQRVTAPPARLFLGIDVGGTHVQAGVMTAEGSLIGRAYQPTGTATDRSADTVLGRIVRAALDACDSAGASVQQISGAGVATAGAVDAPRGVVIASPNLGWSDLPLRDMLQERLDRPVIIENDVNAAALAEWYAARAASGETGDLFAVWVGTGVGGGIIINGAIHHGAQHTAGEIGHLILVPGAPDGRRTVEDLCSRRGLRALLAEAEYAGASSLSAKDIAARWREGVPVVREHVDRAAALLGLAIANAVTLLAFDRVVIGGGMTEALGEEWLQEVRRSYAQHVFPPQLQGCRIAMTALTSDAGILGAARVAALRA